MHRYNKQPIEIGRMQRFAMDALHASGAPLPFEPGVATFNTYTDKVSGRPLLVDQIAGKMLAEGVILQAWVSHFVIAPPLIVERDEIERGVGMLDKYLSLADELAD